jgi:hypothetical protein
MEEIGASPRVRGLKTSAFLWVADRGRFVSPAQDLDCKGTLQRRPSALSWLAAIPSTLATGTLTALFRNAAASGACHGEVDLLRDVAGAPGTSAASSFCHYHADDVAIEIEQWST